MKRNNSNKSNIKHQNQTGWQRKHITCYERTCYILHIREDKKQQTKQKKKKLHEKNYSTFKIEIRGKKKGEKIKKTKTVIKLYKKKVTPTYFKGHNKQANQ